MLFFLFFFSLFHFPHSSLLRRSVVVPRRKFQPEMRAFPRVVSTEGRHGVAQRGSPLNLVISSVLVSELAANRIL